MKFIFISQLIFLSFLGCDSIAIGSDTMPFEKLINYERVDRNLAPLSIDKKLQCASQTHALDIGKNKLCTHDGTDRSSFATRLRKCGFDPATVEEVIVCAVIKPSDAIKNMLDSPKHKQIVLDQKWEKIGCGMNKNYWVCIFAK
jgi:uncharacterized protein YkwD